MYSFLEFEFDDQQQLLFKQGQSVTLTANQGKLLALLLSQPQQVLSKDDIMAHVWPDRVVSEQVVFQNVSQLRAILGEGAIKTFPKRGYQWQLTLTNKKQQLEQESEQEQPNKTLVMLFGLLFASLVLFFVKPWQVSTAEQSPITTKQISVIPFSYQLQQLPQDTLTEFNEQLLTTTANIQLTRFEQDVDNWTFINSPYMVRNQFVDVEEQLVMSGILHQKQMVIAGKQQTRWLVEYLIQGQYRHYQGYQISDELPKAIAAIKQQIAILTQSKYFELPSDTQSTAELLILHGSMPNNLGILQHLSYRLIRENNLDVAAAHIEKLKQAALAQDNPLYHAYSEWLKGEVLWRLEQYQSAKVTLELANEMMAQNDLYALQSQVSKIRAEVMSFIEPYEDVEQVLFQSASQARIANRAVQEIRAYTLLSIKASKYKVANKKYEYLHMAEALLAEYQLDASHYMLIEYHYALFEKDIEKRTEHYKNVLSKPVTPRNFWVFISVSEQLMDLYIEQKNWQLASQIANQVPKKVNSDYLNALVNNAKGDIDSAINYGQSAFNLARAQGNRWAALDMALLLLDINHKAESPLLDDVNVRLYRQYITTAAHKNWIRRNNKTLTKLGISFLPYQQSQQ